MDDLLKNLNPSRGGIPATAEVKNKDRFLIMEDPLTQRFFNELMEGLTMLRLRYLRTLIIMRKEHEPNDTLPEGPQGNSE